MKFLITWTLHEEKRHDTLSLFAKMPAEQEEALMGDDLQLLSRWHDLVGGTGVAIYEAASVEAISAYALAWNKYMDLEIVPVVDDAGAKQIGSQIGSEG